MARAQLGISPDELVVGIVGRLVPIKDVATFLRAMSLLGEGLPRLKVVVAGDGEDRPALQRIAADLGLNDRCRFLGWRSDLPSIYAALDVLALSSINEGTPVSIIEGMAAGVPVVATRVGGVPDVVRHGRDGLLVEPRNPQALASAISQVLSDRILAESLGSEGRRSALAQFDISRLVSDIGALYSELVDPAAATSVGRAQSCAPSRGGRD
jgi:glycosyltransferase involved in cell wall biosynthesis